MRTGRQAAIARAEGYFDDGKFVEDLNRRVGFRTVSQDPSFAEHLMAESGITVDPRGKRRTEWTLRSKHADNDWLDCMVGNCVAASLLGCRVRAVEPMVDGTPNFKRITAENVIQFYG